MTLNDILNRIDELNSMCDYNCYYEDCGLDCSHTACFKNRCKEMEELDSELMEWL